MVQPDFIHGYVWVFEPRNVSIHICLGYLPHGMSGRMKINIDITRQAHITAPQMQLKASAHLPIIVYILCVASTFEMLMLV